MENCRSSQGITCMETLNMWQLGQGTRKTASISLTEMMFAVRGGELGQLQTELLR